MDGNDSLKRVLRREPLFDYRESDTGDIQLVRVSNELPDQQQVEGDYYIPRSQVSRWTIAPVPSINPHSRSTTAKDTGLLDDDKGPCSERWKNMSEQHTAQAWGIFDETGIFVSLCRHGFILLLTDMVQSGEGYVHVFA